MDVEFGRLDKVLEQMLDLVIIRDHEIEVVELGGLCPLHEGEQHSEKDVEVFDLKDLLAHLTEMLVEVGLVLLWNGDKLAQLEQLRHD